MASLQGSPETDFAAMWILRRDASGLSSLLTRLCACVFGEV